MLPAWVAVGLGFFLMSRINSLGSFYGSFLLIAIGMSFGSFVVINMAIAHCFIKKRSRAMTLVYVGFGLSGTLVPLVAMAISWFGWRETALTVGIGVGIIGVALSSVIRHEPSRYGYLPDGEPVEGSEATNHPEGGSQHPGASFTARQALKTRSFWLLSCV